MITENNINLIDELAALINIIQQESHLMIHYINPLLNING